MSQNFKVNVSAVVFNKGKVLIQQRAFDEDIYPGLWGIPGGTVELSDDSLDSALEREIFEEVGVRIKNPILIQNNIKSKEDKGKVYMTFVAEYSSGEPTAKEETESVSWRELCELDNLDFTPTTKEIIELACKR